MNCMKCGRNIQPDQVFCDSCLAEMEKYPVRPDVAVQIPHRDQAQSPRKVHQRKRQTQIAEEQLMSMKKRFRHLLVVTAVLFLLTVGLSILAGATIHELDVLKLLGRNYSTMDENPSDDTTID